jgi:hypothetical protein
MKYTLFFLLALLAVAHVAHAQDNGDDEDEEQDDLYRSDNGPVEQEKREAEEFFKRLLHPFSTKNEEMKRETREVYEEKCESVVPTQRFCPELKTW